jgi:hypothetical protein
MSGRFRYVDRECIQALQARGLHGPRGGPGPVAQMMLGFGPG